eukprot:snap_masked-scaffold_1-processed-gene-30.54-mRNA-1 protein AED:1.00 eAED:1.00 QI:0/-1/0/0/-1/1/1/0/648
MTTASTKTGEFGIKLPPGSQMEAHVEIPSDGGSFPMNGCFKVHLKDGSVGRLCITDLAKPEEWKTMPHKSHDFLDEPFRKVYGVNEHNVSLYNPRSVSKQKLRELARCKAYVTGHAQFGIFTKLNRNISAVILRQNIIEGKNCSLSEMKKKFPLGTLVEGTLVEIRKPKTAKENTRYFLSLLDSDKNLILNGLEKIEVDEVYVGKIVGIKEYGVFIRLTEGKQITGLCHRSEIEEGLLVFSSKYKVGDDVLVKVIKVELEERRLNFTMKSDAFSEEDVKQLDEKNPTLLKQFQKDNLYGFLQKEKVPQLKPVEESDEEENLAEAESDNEEYETKHEQATKIPKKRKQDDVAPVPIKKVKLEGELLKKLDELEIGLLTEQNSSFLWLQVIAILFSSGELEKGFETIARALRKIDQSEENERLNIWKTRLKLVKEYNEDNLEHVLAEFTTEFGKKKAYLMLFDVLNEKEKWRNFDDLEEVLRQAQKGAKKPSLNIFVKRLQLCFSSNDPEKIEQAREAISAQAMKELDRKKQISFLMSYARLEYITAVDGLGNKERGRTLCETCISSAPKRSDIWRQFIDMEIKFGNMNNHAERLGVRKLFRRTIGIKKSEKVIKGFFKKWLEFEKLYGTPTDIETVKHEAVKFVNKQQV